MKPIRFLRALLCVVLATIVVMQPGCRLMTRRYAGPARDGSTTAMPNPMTVPVANLEFTWNQIVDMTDDYFDIHTEQQVREIGGILMEGRITTKPKAGATCLEPLLRDSTPGYERWHSTLQSIRRSAELRVVPVGGGYQVFVEVQKELEDVSQSEFSTVATSTRRHDGSLVTVDRFDRNRGSQTLGWIPIGRDESLEQEMLRNLHARMFETATVPRQSKHSHHSKPHHSKPHHSKSHHSKSHHSKSHLWKLFHH